MNTKKIEYYRLLQAMLVIALSVFIALTIWHVNLLQGTARVVNYAGIARGATQRLVKLELARMPNPELELQLDILLQELKQGGNVNFLINLQDPYYQSCLETQIAYWEELKNQIAVARHQENYSVNQLVAKSERYYQLADATVGAAEQYSEYIAKLIAIFEYIMVAMLAVLLVLSIILYRMSLKIMQERELLMRHQAEHDAMTELLNRRSFDGMLRLHESSERPFALVLLDVDCFKSFNDNYGHAVGDTVLKRVAETLRATCRQDDHICRIGGDEFAIIMDGMQKEHKDLVEQKLQKIIHHLAKNDDENHAVTLSIGVAFSDSLAGETIFNAADRALYQVKVTGRNNYAYFKAE